ncbi:unnamed protein product [Kuraishia capsulata CBS 1993]|uniref:RNA helicase n=1 Tax=Kuraishia capsulata CBS 1993 TaxID=1382522 RepID=W6MPT5_9ASCO|nr:uncharacterized protein KUCA_T00004330001 [Kuraishia capsulata CBS 1993]CDK28348.1 unnamed protein product [Kuraishia capsulata CBS 1993]
MAVKTKRFNAKKVFGKEPPSSPARERPSKRISTAPKAGAKVVDFYSGEEDDDDDDDEPKSTQIGFSNDELQKTARSLLQVRESLPVYKVKDELLKRILAEKVSILIGETGSGKSTQIPQFLIPHNKRSIAVTQPRRVAAINLATRVAQENGSRLGARVGYSVRFDNRANSSTRLKYLTDGMLLRELMIDPKLSNYSTIIIDEAHERTVLTDLLIGFLKGLLYDKRKNDKEFRIIIMSATLDAERFSKFFDNAPILFVEGKMYPVNRFYLGEPSEDIVDSTIRTVMTINQSEQQGDVLCFLPGQEEIDKAVSSLQKIAPQLPRTVPLLMPLPLYAALPTTQQTKIFNPVKSHERKVILATNIAETSITVPGIKYVVDSGLRKVKVWRHSLGISTLLTMPISQASATQRTGRAGRESSGKCYRLYTEDDYLKLAEQTEAEIMRSDIISSVLMLKKLGVDDILNWNWLQNPGKESMVFALQQLYSLAALNDSGQITDLGRKMAVLPLSPHLSAVLLTAYEMHSLVPVIDITACLSVDNLVLNPAYDRRDEVNEKRRAACILGRKYGDLVMLKELLDIFLDISDTQEKKQWCRDLDLSYKGFKNVIRVRQQLREYMDNLLRTKRDGPSIFELEGETVDEFTGEVKYERTLDVSTLLKPFIRGFISNTAIGMPDRSYRTIGSGQLVAIHPSSLLFSQKLEAIMYIEHVYTTRGYSRKVSSIELSWLQEAAPHLLGRRMAVDG